VSENREEEEKRDTDAKQRLRSTCRNTWETVLQQFQLKNREGPTKVCMCCGGLFFPKSI
jgi:hypothetical protein